MAPAVMAIARRAGTPARVWRRLPYTTKTRTGVCFDIFRFFLGCKSGVFFFLSVYFLQLIFVELYTREAARGPTLINAFLAGYALDSGASCFAVFSKSQPRGRLVFCHTQSQGFLSNEHEQESEVRQKTLVFQHVPGRLDLEIHRKKVIDKAYPLYTFITCVCRIPGFNSSPTSSSR